MKALKKLKSFPTRIFKTFVWSHELHMNSGTTLKMLRTLKGFTQQQVADKLTISQQAYSKMERQQWIENKIIDKVLLLMNYSKQEMEEIRRITFQKVITKQATARTKRVK